MRSSPVKKSGQYVLALKSACKKGPAVRFFEMTAWGKHPEKVNGRKLLK